MIANGSRTGLVAGEHTMAVRARAFRNLASGVEVAPDAFAAEVPGPVYAISALGNPEGFHRTLADLGVAATHRPFRDHHAFVAADLVVPAGASVVVTQKDAAKMTEFETVPAHCWVLEVAIEPSLEFEAALEGALRRHGLLP